jgi:transposase-like protein
MTDDVTTEFPDSDLDRDVSIPGGQTMSSLERDARAVQMHAMRYSYTEIANALGYGNRSNAHRAVRRAHERILKPPVMTRVATEVAELDAIVLNLIGIIHKRHVAVSSGKVVTDDEGRVLEDDGPILAALAQWRQVSESRRKLLGLDAAVKLDVNLDGSEVDAAIRGLVAEMESRGRAMEQRAARGES